MKQQLPRLSPPACTGVGGQGEEDEERESQQLSLSTLAADKLYY